MSWDETFLFLLQIFNSFTKGNCECFPSCLSTQNRESCLQPGEHDLQIEHICTKTYHIRKRGKLFQVCFKSKVIFSEKNWRQRIPKKTTDKESVLGVHGVSAKEIMIVLLISNKGPEARSGHSSTV